MDSSSPGLREALTLRWFTPLGATLLDRINRLLSFLKGTVTEYSIREFFEKRPEIEQKIFVELRKRFSGRCCKPICDKDFPSASKTAFSPDQNVPKRTVATVK